MSVADEQQPSSGVCRQPTLSHTQWHHAAGKVVRVCVAERCCPRSSILLLQGCQVGCHQVQATASSARISHTRQQQQQPQVVSRGGAQQRSWCCQTAQQRCMALGMLCWPAAAASTSSCTTRTPPAPRARLLFTLTLLAWTSGLPDTVDSSSCGAPALALLTNTSAALQATGEPRHIA